MKKIALFAVKPITLHDASVVKEVLKNYKGMVIEDKSYCSEPLKEQLNNEDLYLIDRYRKHIF